MSVFKRFWSLDDKGEEAKAGWFAAYADPNGSDAEKKPYGYVAPLVGWALVHRDGKEEIVGLVASSRVEEADRRTNGSVFVTYFNRSAMVDEQIDALWRQLSDIGRRKQKEYYDKLQQEAESHRRNASSASERRLLSDGAEAFYQGAVRELQSEEPHGGQGDSTDTELPDSGPVEETI